MSNKSLSFFALKSKPSPFRSNVSYKLYDRQANAGKLSVTLGMVTILMIFGVFCYALSMFFFGTSFL